MSTRSYLQMIGDENVNPDTYGTYTTYSNNKSNHPKRFVLCGTRIGRRLFHDNVDDITQSRPIESILQHLPGIIYLIK